MFLKVKGDCLKAKEVMGTNIDLKEGQILSGPEDKIKVMSQKYPDLFELVKADGSSYEQAMKPQKDKRYKKGGRFKFS